MFDYKSHHAALIMSSLYAKMHYSIEHAFSHTKPRTICSINSRPALSRNMVPNCNVFDRDNKNAMQCVIVYLKIIIISSNATSKQK